VQQSSQESFVSQGKQDILTETIGTQEDPSRVRIAGFLVGVRQFFGSASRSSSSATPATQDQLDNERRIKIRIKRRNKMRNGTDCWIHGHKPATQSYAAR